MDIFTDLLVNLSKIFGGNLGLTIIFIGVVSRLIFFPLLKSSHQQIKMQRDLKPKLDAIKRKYKEDRRKQLEEQTKLFQEAGFNPAVGCFSALVQLVVAIVLLNSLTGLLKAGLDNHFLVWDLAKPDTFKVSGIGFALPGILVILTAIATLIQSRMMLPEPLPLEKTDTKKEIGEKEDLTEALASSQGQLVYLFPIIILFSGTIFSSGLALYWLVSTFTGVIQQYYISGLGGLKPWLNIIQRN
jgi:YidC/Oxa1 family membrane protein insertase